MKSTDLHEFLKTKREFAAKDLNRVLGISNDYTMDVPFLQFPVPAPKGSAHAVALKFSSPLDPSTVTPHTVMMLVKGEAEAVQANVSVVDEGTIVIQPHDPLRRGRSDQDLVYIIVTPDVTMADGRRFAGISHVVSAA
jgi:hypothetical protein